MYGTTTVGLLRQRCCALYKHVTSDILLETTALTDTADPKTHVPQPHDQYDGLATRIDPAHPLSPFQEAFILSAFPSGTRVIKARFCRDVYLPCPVRVRVRLPTGTEQTVILRMDRQRGGVATEALVLPALTRLGLPVPMLLAGPVSDPTDPQARPMTLISQLPGSDIYAWLQPAPDDQTLPGKDVHVVSGADGSPTRYRKQDLQLAIRLILEGVEHLHQVSDAVAAEGVGKILPHKTLLAELEAVVQRGGPWLEGRVFADAVQQLMPVVARIDTPLVFSNGDYNPGNFLSDGATLTGLVDFSLACFEDPYIGFARYWTSDWFPLNKAGLVEGALAAHNRTLDDFAPRLALRCLWTLQREIPVVAGGHHYAAYRALQLRLLQNALARLG